jgi:dynein heavy chain, axonemal
MDEELTNLSNIQGSRYVKRLATEVNSLHEQLIIASDTLEQWKRCQRAWIYLDKIFQSQDIVQSCKEDHKNFVSVDRNWTKLMKKVSTSPGVMLNCVPEVKSESGARAFSLGRMKEFLRYNKTMDEIEKNLADYLDEKRRDFARFYFISNDELLTLLANQAKLNVMQGYLGNLFEGISKFGLDSEGAEITAIESR